MNVKIDVTSGTSSVSLFAAEMRTLVRARQILAALATQKIESAAETLTTLDKVIVSCQPVVTPKAPSLPGMEEKTDQSGDIRGTGKWVHDGVDRGITKNMEAGE